MNTGELKTADIFHDLEAAAGTGQVLTMEPLSKHTTFQIGGPADYFVKIKDKETLLSVLRLLCSAGADYFILGNGSNLLVSDEGYRGVIISTVHGMRESFVDEENAVLKAGAGMMLSETVQLAYSHSLDSLSFAAGIPGTVGGALVMNAGAFGAEMKDVVREASAIDLDVLMPHEIVLDREALEFHYRGSVAERRHLAFTGATFALKHGDKDEIGERMSSLTNQRREKQPLNYPSAGSAFKRPEGHFAGKLIMDAGLKGYTVGGAQVAEKHCGFVVNRGGAKAADVYRLMKDVREKVYEAFGVVLEPEIMFLGEFPEWEGKSHIPEK